MTYVHNLTPFALRFTEHFGIRWYGLAYLSGFVIGYYTILMLAKRRGTLLQVEQIADFITYVAIGVLAGGRIGYCLFYAPELFATVDQHFPYWGVLKVNEGGMASHGGMLGVVLVCFLYGRRLKIPFLHCLDLTVLGSSLGFFFGRIANFINGELFGRAAPIDMKWAVKFPTEMLYWVQKDFPKLYELKPAVDALGTFKTDAGDLLQASGVTWSHWLESFGADAIARQHVYDIIEGLIAAVQSKNLAVTEALAPALTARHPSQLYQAVLEGLLVFVCLMILWRRPQKPGVISAWFATLYCSARIVGEHFRMPDAQIGFQALGLTRGQWLSITFLSIALVWLVWAYRRPAPKLGGWAGEPSS